MKSQTLRILSLFTLFYFSIILDGKAQGTFTNPIMQAESPDPYVVYNNGFYYFMVTTGDGVWIHKAANLQDVGNAPRTKVWSSGGEIRRDVWAPELHYINGKWYIYACGNLSDDGFNMRMFVLEGNSQDPLGSYTYRGILAPEASGIDESPWQDPATGILYMTWSQFDPQGQTIWIARMESPTQVSNQRVRISEPVFNWERTDGLVNEGPIFLQKGNSLHIIYSASQCASAAYALGRLTCTDGNYLNPGSWQKVGPVFQRNDANEVYGTGHNGFTKSPDGTEDWIIYHAKHGTSFTNSDRSTRIQKFTWNPDNTPNFGVPVREGVAIPVPSVNGAVQTPFNGVINLPGIVEAENFDNGGEGVTYHDANPQNMTGAFRNEGVDIEASTEGYYNLCFSENGEWTEYTVNVTQSGNYAIDARVASTIGGSFHLEFNGQNVTGALAVPNTGGWQNWQWLHKEVYLNSGTYVMRFAIDQAGFNTNGFIFTNLGGGNGIVSGQTYRLVNRNSNQVLEIGGCNTDDGARAQQWPWLNSGCQKWKVEATDSGYYKLTAQHSNKTLDIVGCSNDIGAGIQQWPWVGGVCEQWSIESTDNGFYRIISRASGLALEVQDALTTNGANVRQWPWNTAFCQQWKLEVVGGTAKSSLKSQTSEELVENETQIPDLILFPNPANDQVEILFPQTDGNTASLQITNILGEIKVSKNGLMEGKTTINISNLNPGIYVVSLDNGSKIITKKLIIKN